MRRMVADFARNQVRQEYRMDKAIPVEYTTTSPSYPPFASVYQKAPQPNRKPPPQHQKPAPSSSPESTLVATSARKGRKSNTTRRRLSSIIENTVWNSTISQLPSFPKTSSGHNRLRIVLYSRGNEGTRSLKLESHLMSAIGEKFEAYTAICCDFNTATMQQQISYAYHADIVSLCVFCSCFV